MIPSFLVWILVAIAAVIAGKEAGKLLFTGKKQLTGMRKAAQSLAISLREAGLKKIPEALEEFAVGDVADLLEGIKDLSLVLKSGNAAIVQELDGTFERVLGVKLNSPEGRALIKAKLVEAEKIASAAITIAAVVA